MKVLRLEDWQRYEKVRVELENLGTSSASLHAFSNLVRAGLKDPSFEISDRQFELLEGLRSRSTYADDFNPAEKLHRILKGGFYGRKQTLQEAQQTVNYDAQLYQALPHRVSREEVLMLREALEDLLKPSRVLTLNYTMLSKLKVFIDQTSEAKLKTDYFPMTNPGDRFLYLFVVLILRAYLPEEHAHAQKIKGLEQGWKLQAASSSLSVLPRAIDRLPTLEGPPREQQKPRTSFSHLPAISADVSVPHSNPTREFEYSDSWRLPQKFLPWEIATLLAAMVEMRDLHSKNKKVGFETTEKQLADWVKLLRTWQRIEDPSVRKNFDNPLLVRRQTVPKRETLPEESEIEVERPSNQIDDNLKKSVRNSLRREIIAILNAVEGYSQSGRFKDRLPKDIQVANIRKLLKDLRLPSPAMATPVPKEAALEPAKLEGAKEVVVPAPLENVIPRAAPTISLKVLIQKAFRAQNGADRWGLFLESYALYLQENLIDPSATEESLKGRLQDSPEQFGKEFNQRVGRIVLNLQGVQTKDLVGLGSSSRGRARKK